MEDLRIIELFEARDESAIIAAKEKYGAYMNSVAYNILRSHEDSEECLNDSYMKTWNAIPPAKPNNFKAFLARITRNTALDLYEKKNAEKRGGGELALALDELAECIAGVDINPEKSLEMKELAADINDMLDTLKPEARKIFVLRYFYMYSVSEIADILRINSGKVSVSLNRSRAALKEKLEGLGY